LNWFRSFIKNFTSRTVEKRSCSELLLFQLGRDHAGLSTHQSPGKWERERQAREAKRTKEEEELMQCLKMLVSNSKEPSRADKLRQVLQCPFVTAAMLQERQERLEGYVAFRTRTRNKRRLKNLMKLFLEAADFFTSLQQPVTPRAGETFLHLIGRAPNGSLTRAANTDHH
jgi:methionyl-tRNA synthetase